MREKSSLARLQLNALVLLFRGLQTTISPRFQANNPGTRDNEGPAYVAWTLQCRLYMPAMIRRAGAAAGVLGTDLWPISRQKSIGGSRNP
jgi:hypothetical protein